MAERPSLDSLFDDPLKDLPPKPKASATSASYTLQTGGEGDAFPGVQETPKPGMPYGEQMKGVGEFYGALGRGAVKGVLGTPGELEYLGAYGLPNYLASKFPKAFSATKEKDQVQIFPRAETVGKMIEEVGLGKTPEQLKGIETIGELAGGLVGFGERPIAAGTAVVRKMSEPSVLQKALSTVQFSGEELAAAAKRAAGEKLSAAEEKALSSAVDAVDRQMNRISGLKEVTEKASPEVEKMKTAARSESKLVAPETAVDFQNKADLNSVIRSIADKRYGGAEAMQKQIGGRAFEDYKIAANLKQEIQPFALSPEGKGLLGQLDDIIKGGSGRLRTYSPEESRLASEIKSALFPAGKKEKPVDFKLVDDKLRELRDKAMKKGPEAFGAVEKERVVGIADRIENALKSWVGETNYPREIYAEASEELNRFRTRLGEALSAREEIPYATEAGMRETARPANILFESRESVNFGKQLLGGQEVNQLAEKFASNQIAGKDAKAVSEWMKDPKNEFIYEISGLSEKIAKYGQSLATREGDAKAFAELQKQATAKIGEAQKGITEAKGVAEKQTAEAQKAFATAQKTADDLTRTLQNEDPAKLYSSFTKMRPKLEETGVFDKTGLDALEAEISRASKIADAKQRRDAIVGAVGTMLKKIVTLGLR